MPPEPDRVRFDAVVLAGGRSSRLGGVDKASLEFDGQTLLARTLQAASGAGHAVVVGPAPAAGLPPGVFQTREDPPYAGPAAAIAAGLDALDANVGDGGNAGRAGSTGRAEYTLVLACDMPYVRSTVHCLLAEAVAMQRGAGERGAGQPGVGAKAADAPPSAGADEPSVAGTDEPSAVGTALMAQDDGGKLQPLAALYETGALTAAVSRRRAHSQLAGMSVFRLVASLQVVPVAVAASATHDVDTWQDAHTFGIRGPR